MPRAVLFDMFNTLLPGGDDGTRDRVLSEMAALLQLDASTFIRAQTDTWPRRSVGAMGDVATEIRTIANLLGGSPSDQQIAAAVALRRQLTTDLYAAAPPTTLTWTGPVIASLTDLPAHLTSLRPADPPRHPATPDSDLRYSSRLRGSGVVRGRVGGPPLTGR